MNERANVYFSFNVCCRNFNNFLQKKKILKIVDLFELAVHVCVC